MRDILIFPGQGSQSTAMLKAYENDARIKQTFEEAHAITGVDFWEMGYDADENIINQTINTQPLIFITSIAIYRVISDKVDAKLFAGHSLGEYAALVAAEVMSFTDALRIVKSRSEIMQSAVPEGVGAMAVLIGLDVEQVEEICNETKALLQAQDDIQNAVSPANINAPGQIVIGGYRKAIMAALERAKEKGAKRALLLPMSVPSHCELLKEASTKFSEVLKDFHFFPPKTLVIQNATLAIHKNPEDIKAALVSQLYRPVNWIKMVDQFSQYHPGRIIECGPGKVLTGLSKKIITEQIPIFNTTESSLALEALA